MDTRRALSGAIGIYPNARGDWSAVVMIRRARGAYSWWPEYFVHGDSAEAALAALKQAVAEGEEGWTW
ncbi:MAG: hypothetical protein VB144_11695 [Clostridia bacterium]|nr:hypothetical protein [Clostridia bacterium]